MGSGQRAGGPKTPRAWMVYMAAGAVVVAIYSRLPWGVPGAAVYDLLGLSAGIAMLAARRESPDTARRACVLMGTGLVLVSAGNATWSVYDLVLHTYPDGSIADVFYLSGYGFLAFGVLRLVRLRTRGRDREAFIDALILAAGMGILALNEFVLPNLGNPNTSLLAKAATAAYPLADVLLVGVLARLAFFRSVRLPAFWLLLAGIASTLVADVVYAAYGQIGATSPAWTNLFWTSSYVLLGAAALHPSMARLADPLDSNDNGPGLVNLVTLAAGVVLSIVVLVPGGAGPEKLVGLLIFSLIVLARIAYLARRADRAWVAERRAELATRRALAAEEASREKSRFLSRTSHELRTPLNAILGFAQLLEMDESQGDKGEAVDHILGAGKHLLALVDDLLEISHIGSGGLNTHGSALTVSGLIAESVDLVSAEAEHVGVRIMLEPAGEYWVIADGPRLGQVLLNLLSNAVKFNRRGGSVTISTTGGSGTVRIAISDTGHGISDTDMDAAFDPFDRLRADSLGVEGTGLGLTLARGLVEAMGGTIEVVSAVGVGSTFTVVLPEVCEPSRAVARTGLPE